MQDQRRLGAIIVPNKEEVLPLAKELSIIDGNATELSKDRLTTLLYEELRKWYNTSTLICICKWQIICNYGKSFYLLIKIFNSFPWSLPFFPYQSIPVLLHCCLICQFGCIAFWLCYHGFCLLNFKIHLISVFTHGRYSISLEGD